MFYIVDGKGLVQGFESHVGQAQGSCTGVPHGDPLSSPSRACPDKARQPLLQLLLDV